MELTPAQKIIATDKHRFRVLNSGRRFGKTQLAILEMVAKAVSQSDRRVAYIAPTFQQARDIAWNELKKLCEPIKKSTNEQRLEIKVYTQDGGHSVISLRGWEAVETLRGQFFDFIVIDEIASMKNFWTSWQEVIRPTLTDRKGQVLFCSTPKAFNHFYDLYNLENDEKVGHDFKSFHFTSYDNPHLPSEEIDAARASMTEDRFAQEYLAEFKKSQGLVYKEFSRERHLFGDEERKLITKNAVLIGIDWGYTNPTAVLTVVRDQEGVFWVTDEYYKTSKVTAEIIEYTKTLGGNIVYPDPAEPDRIEECRRAGLNVREVSKDIAKGIDAVRNLFKMDKLRIHKSCLNLIQELESYSYPDRKPGHNEDEDPIDEDNHACFAAGTVVDGKNIEDIGIQTGIKDVYEYEIGGEKLVVTSDHPILTQRGFVNIDTLRYDDMIWKKRLSFMAVSGGLGIQQVLNGLKGIIIAVAGRILEARTRDFIGLFGKKRTVPSRMDLIYITLMAIPAIINWTILSVLAAMNTIGIIVIKKKIRNFIGLILSVLSSLLLSGLRLLPGRREGEKLGRLMRIICWTEWRLRRIVIFAIKYTAQKAMDEIDSATLIADKKLYAGRVPVYNLIRKNGMYRANGILVSNCDALRYVLFMQRPDDNLNKARTYYPHLARKKFYGMK